MSFAMAHPARNSRRTLWRSSAAILLGVLAAVASQLAARTLARQWGADSAWLLPTLSVGFVAVAVIGVLVLRLFMRRR